MDPKLNATWLPYIRYLQDSNSKKDDQNLKKPNQTVACVRKISIFARKASGISSEGLHRPPENATTEPARRKSQKAAGSEIFHSNESLQDVNSCSTADQHTDDEHGKKGLRTKFLSRLRCTDNIRSFTCLWYSIHFKTRCDIKGLLTEREVCTVKYQTEVF